MRKLRNGLFAAALLAAAGCERANIGGGTASAAAKPPAAAVERPAAQVVASDAREITIDNFSFTPGALTVTPGTRVTWVNHDDVPHTVISAAKPRVFKSDALDTDEKFSFVFTQPGSYPYFCSVHPHMTGQIIVSKQ